MLCNNNKKYERIDGHIRKCLNIILKINKFKKTSHKERSEFKKAFF